MAYRHAGPERRLRRAPYRRQHWREHRRFEHGTCRTCRRTADLRADAGFRFRHRARREERLDFGGRDPQTGTVPPGTTIWCVRADIPAGDDAHPDAPTAGCAERTTVRTAVPDTEQSAEHAIWRARGPEPAERATGCTECAEPQSVRCANGQSVRAQQRHAGRSGQSERPDTVAVRAGQPTAGATGTHAEQHHCRGGRGTRCGGDLPGRRLCGAHQRLGENPHVELVEQRLVKQPRFRLGHGGRRSGAELGQRLRERVEVGRVDPDRCGPGRSQGLRRDPRQRGPHRDEQPRGFRRQADSGDARQRRHLQREGGGHRFHDRSRRDQARQSAERPDAHHIREFRQPDAR